MMTMRRNIYRRLAARLIVTGFFAFGAASPAAAVTCGTALSPLTVSVTGVNFGNYDAQTSARDDAEGTVTVACALGLDVLPAFTVSLSMGNANHYHPRRMASGTATLDYNLYTSASHVTVWGDGTGDTETRSYPGLLVLGNAELTVYGSVPQGQFANAGIYSDTIVVTIDY
ncbi:MAG: spore coat U domain-containing protein [Betaproteobacteria bacterium]|nr:spore coat U domain-containing protein [Betaproteobacteria bacterium]